jgi:hypothetical protein
VPECKRSVLSVSAIEKKGFEVLFWDGQALIMPRGSSSDTTIVFEVRESNLYKLKSQTTQAMASSNRVTEDKEHVAPTIEQIRGNQPSGSCGKEQPSKSVQKKSWYKMAMQDAQEQKASRSMIRGKSSQQGLSEMEK